MKKKTLLITISCLLLPFSALALVFNCNVDVFSLKGVGNHYGLSFNSSKNKFFSGTGSTDYSGSATVKTNNNNDIKFEYYTVAGGSSSAWHLIKNGGYFYNITPIHGLDSLTIMCTSADKEFQISWGRDLTFDLGSKNYLSSTDSVYCNFDGDTPTYFKFTNISGSNISIKEMSVDLDCVNYYPVLSLDCDSIQGTVTGGGTKNAGESVTIAATPNTGYEFVGWFENSSLVSLNFSYTFTIGYSDLSYTARFKCSNYNLVVESESLTKGQVSNSSGAYAYLDDVTISATPNPGYSFSGWYNGDSLVSTNNPYTFTMPYNDILYVAKFATNSYQLNLSSSDTSLGSITGGGTFLYGSNVTISATPNTGVAFLGWFDSKEDLVSEQKSYSFTMPYNNLEYTAKFEWVPHSISLSVNDDNMGFVSGSGSYHYGQSVTLTATPTEHHSFFGWYDGDILLSQESSYTFDMPNNSLEYEARFVQNYYLNVYSDNEKMGTVTAPTEWGAGLNVTLTANAKEGYALDYWCDEFYDELSCDDNYTFVMPEHDITVIAVFMSFVTLTLDSNFSEQVVTVYGAGAYSPRSNVTIYAQALEGFAFDGWYDTNFSLISKSNQYSFSITQDTKLIAHYNYNDLDLSYSNIDTTLKTCAFSGFVGSLPNIFYIPKIFENYVVTSIVTDTFKNCLSLTSIVIPDSILTIENRSFSGCPNLESITLPFVGGSQTSNQYLGYIFGATTYFDNSKYVPSSLKHIVLSNKCTSIANYALRSCSSLRSVVIPDTVVSIGKSAFEYCTWLDSITLPFVGGSQTSNQYLGYIFGATSYSDNPKYVPALSLITLNNKCTSIANYALSKCQFKSIVIPTSVTSIKSYAFYQCDYLSTVYYAGTRNEWFDISVGSSGNEPLKKEILYYSELKPEVSGQYWHYVDGVPVVWQF